MYIVTGGAGFIGSNLIEALNKRAIDDILLVDNLADASKLPNINDLEIADYLDQNAFVDRINHEGCLPDDVQAVFHLGACSDTMEQDGKYMMANNYQYSRDLYQWCATNNIAFIYASSAAVYGASSVFREQRKYEKPLNIYGYSKFLFDQYVRRNPANSQVVGLRYFNVYGPREAHKGRMASVAFHHFHQLHKQGYVELFVGSHGYAQGEQKRDFVYVGDVVAAKLHFLDNPQTSGIFNLGTGQAQSFNQLALAGVNAWRNDSSLELVNAVDDGFIRYVPFPEGLADRYQAFTQADINALRASGFSQSFLNVDEAVCEYYSWLAKK